MKTKDICLAVILVLSLIVIGYFTRYYVRKRKGPEGFSYATPATPKVREGISGVFDSLTGLVALGKAFETEAARIEKVSGKMPAAAAGIRPSVAALTTVLDRTSGALITTPPTYANYLAIYRGLVSTDDTLLKSASAYILAGRDIHQGMALNPPSTPDGDVADIGNILMDMGRRLRTLVTNVHILGVTLDVE